MNSEGAKGQNIVECERIERKEFPHNSLAALLIKTCAKYDFLDIELCNGIVNIDSRVFSPLMLTQALLAKDCPVYYV